MLYIDRGSNIPIYQQIYEQMKRDIISGNLPVNHASSPHEYWPANCRSAETR